MAGCCEHGNELLVCVKGLSLFELLSEYRSIEQGVPLLACCQTLTRSFAPRGAPPYLMSRTAGGDIF